MAATAVFHTAGRRWVNQILNGSTARPANLYVLLRTLDGTGGHTADAAAADTLTSNLNEATATGYARQALTNNATNFPEAADSADSVITAAQVTFTFGATQNGITHAALATTSDNTGVLIQSAPTAVTRNVANGDSLKETISFRMTAAA